MKDELKDELKYLCLIIILTSLVYIAGFIQGAKILWWE